MREARSLAEAPIDAQVAALRTALSSNDIVSEVLVRAAALNLPGWYLAAGCLFQTVWNVITDRPPTEGIGDYDLLYLDSTDLSWEAEDAVIQSGQEIFGDLPAPVEIRNEARVHLWYEQKFGVTCPPYRSTESAIDSFPARGAPAACGDTSSMTRSFPLRKVALEFPFRKVNGGPLYQATRRGPSVHAEKFRERRRRAYGCPGKISGPFRM